MTVVINGTSGITDVNGTAAAPAITGTDTDTGVFFGTNTVSLSTGGTERLQVDSSGNLGLGVTPSAWRSIQKSLDIGVAASVTGFTALPYLRSYANAYINSGGSVIYKINGEAGAYTIDGNVHAWYNAPSGTAGNAITFTQAMTLDASGNLGVGTTSPKLNGNAGTFLTVSNTTSDQTGWLEVQGAPTVSGSGAGIVSFNSSNRAGADKRIGQITCVRGSASDSGILTFSTWDAGTGAERARIDSSGNFYLSGNTTMGPLTDNQGTVGDGTHRWRVIYAVNGTIQTSDGTQKTEVKPSALGLDFINSLNPVSFKWIDSTYGRTHYGFIAQEIEQTLKDKNAGDFGGLVIDDMEDGSKLYGLRHHELIAPLVKAIQEQQAIITQLQADVEALKGQA